MSVPARLRADESHKERGWDTVLAGILPGNGTEVQVSSSTFEWIGAATLAFAGFLVVSLLLYGISELISRLIYRLSDRSLM